MSVALNPEKFAKHFFDLGVSQQLKMLVRKSKNINMDVQKSTKISYKK